MRKRPVFLIGALLLVLISAAYAVPKAGRGSAASAGFDAPVSTQAPSAGSGRGPSILPTVAPTPIGAPFTAVTTPAPESPSTRASAIRPTRLTLDPAAPAFTLQDVADYVNSHPLRYTLPGTKPTIESIEFLPNRDVNARFTTSTGRPDDALMCLVTLRGSFLVTGPGGEANIKSDVAYWVFDAHTGNELLVVVGEP